jgi:hypothetical protein
MLYTVEHQREISAVAGPYSVTLFRHQGNREDRSRAVILYCITRIGTPEACDEKATEFAKNFGARIKTPMLSVRYALAAAEESLPRSSVVAQVRAQDGSCSAEGVCYYPSIEGLAMKARSSRHWQQGTTMVWAASASKYLILNQVAPDSCEFMVVTPGGFADVLSCQRYDQDELTQQLLTYVERMEEEAAEH